MGSIKDILVKLISDTKNKLILAGITVIALLFFLNHWNNKRFQEATERAVLAETNLAAAQDTIRVTKAKNNELEYNKLIYRAKNEKTLKALSDSLARQVELTKGAVAVIQNIGFTVKHDTIRIPTTVVVSDSVVKIRSRIDTTYSSGNFRTLAFESEYREREGRAFTTILEDKIGFSATVGLKQNEKKQYEIFVRPHYPGMEVGLLEGAIIEENFFKKDVPKQKPKLITAGINAGWMPIAVDLKTGQTTFDINRFGVGAGINFNISRLLGK